jgi:hypothetical protein
LCFQVDLHATRRSSAGKIEYVCGDSAHAWHPALKAAV